MKLKSADGTMIACFIGYITQAIVNNFAPLLFLRFLTDFHLSLSDVTLITTLNFAIQLLADLFSAKYADRIGYRRIVILAHVFCAAGLAGLAVFPALFSNPYAGILFSVILYASGGGIIEVVISPIVESSPSDNREAAMSLLHSFYCWGHVGVIVLSAVFFRTLGMEHWGILALLWALVPLFNCALFSVVPISHPSSSGRDPSSGTLFSRKVFWILLVMMIAAGASEQAMSQWSSAFAESALHVSKTVGDLAGPCMFALLMGISRAMYAAKSDGLPLLKAMKLSCILCLFCYGLAAYASSPVFALLGCALCGFSVGIFWPGTLSTAAAELPFGGTAMYAWLALAGDAGCAAGPSLTGFSASFMGGNLRSGLAISAVFPIVLLLGISILKKERD